MKQSNIHGSHLFLHPSMFSSADELCPCTVCTHVLYHHMNTMFNQSSVSYNTLPSSRCACLCLWLFSQSSWWLVLTDDRLSRASDHTNSVSSTLSLTVTPAFIYSAWLALLQNGRRWRLHLNISRGRVESSGLDMFFSSFVQYNPFCPFVFVFYYPRGLF